MTKRKTLSLNSLQLKLIGFVMTLIGALGIVFFSGEEQQMTRLILEFISYPAIAIFTFLLVEGFRHTASTRKYAFGLIAAAVITEPFYDYACIGSWMDYGSANGQNFLFSLVLCLVILIFLQSAQNSEKFKAFMTVSLLLALPFWALLSNARFSGIAMYLTAIFYLLREKPVARDIVAAVVGTVLKVTGGVSVLLTRGYNQERGSYPKYLFYALYPAMWIILAMIKLFA